MSPGRFSCLSQKGRRQYEWNMKLVFNKNILERENGRDYRLQAAAGYSSAGR